MTKRKNILVLGILLLLIVSLLFLFYRGQKTPTPPLPPPGPLNIINANPPKGKSQALFTSTAILFTFDSPLVVSSAVVSIEPRTEISVELGRGSPSTLAVFPLGEWKEGVSYTIKIKKGLLGTENRVLQEDLTHTFEFEFPDDVIEY